MIDSWMIITDSEDCILCHTTKKNDEKYFGCDHPDNNTKQCREDHCPSRHDEG